MESCSEEGGTSDDEDSEEEAVAPDPPTAWLPPLLASERIRHVAWRFDALPEVALLALSISSEPAPPPAAAGSAAVAPGDSAVRHVVVGHGPGRFIIYLDAAAPSELLCDIGGLPPCLWVPLGASEEDVLSALSQLAAVYPFAAKAQPAEAIWASRPPATASPSPATLLPRLLLGGDDDVPPPEPSGPPPPPPSLPSSLGAIFDALLATPFVVSADSPAEVRAAELGCSHTELLEVELRAVHSGKQIWLHALAGMRALSAQPATLRAEHVCAEVVDGVNAELGTCYDTRTPLDVIAALLAAGVQCIGAGALRAALAPPPADGRIDGGGDGDADDGGEGAASALHVLHFLRAPNFLDDVLAAAAHCAPAVRAAAAAVAAQLGAAPGHDAARACKLLDTMAAAEADDVVCDVIARAREHVDAGRLAAGSDSPRTAGASGSAGSAGAARLTDAHSIKKRHRSGRKR
ncbi:hypothetical protein KFE25_013943 [Diacronema lutheri]|uniref:Uncharacterized protein n=1 Tax=Diacronema lutheri TaxID=2081491 RepID=A0A8J5XCR3_DIALT|nr:hypothetical protein KFE25_013943 [Diacronema lutheri]